MGPSSIPMLSISILCLCPPLDDICCSCRLDSTTSCTLLHLPLRCLPRASSRWGRGHQSRKGSQPLELCLWFTNLQRAMV